MGFLEGHIAEEKVFKGKVFPKTLLPPISDVLPAAGELPDLAELVKADREWIAETLQEHSAILFRGFYNIRSAEDYSRVIKAFGWEEFRYQGPADRIKLADRVYTANAVPSDIMISFHHEMAMIKEFPARIIFFCQQPPPVGGQTTIIPSSIVVEKVEEELPQVAQKMEQDGIIFTLHTKSTTYNNNTTTSDPTVWQRMLKTTDEVQAHNRALDMLACKKAKFNSDGTADFTFGPMNPIREFDGKRVMFYRIVGYETGERDAFVTYGDGSSVPSDANETIKKIYEDNCVDINWQKGDILLVDNLAVQHARRPGKPPRVILVSLSN